MVLDCQVDGGSTGPEISFARLLDVGSSHPRLAFTSRIFAVVVGHDGALACEDVHDRGAFCEAVASRFGQKLHVMRVDLLGPEAPPCFRLSCEQVVGYLASQWLTGRLSRVAAGALSLSRHCHDTSPSKLPPCSAPPQSPRSDRHRPGKIESSACRGRSRTPLRLAGTMASSSNLAEEALLPRRRQSISADRGSAAFKKQQAKAVDKASTHARGGHEHEALPSDAPPCQLHASAAAPLAVATPEVPYRSPRSQHRIQRESNPSALCDTCSVRLKSKCSKVVENGTIRVREKCHMSCPCCGIQIVLRLVPSSATCNEFGLPSCSPGAAPCQATLLEGVQLELTSQRAEGKVFRGSISEQACATFCPACRRPLAAAFGPPRFFPHLQGRISKHSRQADAAKLVG